MESSLSEWRDVPDLSVVARERTALATIADAIAAASIGKGFRVAVSCPDTHRALVDHLAQALHARGRICRCLTEPDLDDGSGLLPERHEEGWPVVVIVSGLAMETDRGVRHVNISVTAGIPTHDSGDVSHQGTSEPTSSTGGEPDIVLDYRDPHGPLIRYMAPHLSPDGQR
ncbi:hypothetical protein M2302_001260 [Micromonospora sp. A200]|uniref:hypothetical protein n=1 Tax=Micromonospora sp. A200 TaxID=2940568 RepID=UPI0024753E86|nr:hypothetical protein [Micromonospora sp. A200]MDH6461094.1 hypothetical protein [Micromonospora sp. A200]